MDYICLFGWSLNMNWQQGYAPPNSDRREGVLKRKRLEYLDCVSQYYDIPDTERSDDEINMLRQVYLMLIDHPIITSVQFFMMISSNHVPVLPMLLDCCWLSKNGAWCFFLSRRASSEIPGAHSLYLVGYFTFPFLV